MKKGQRTLVYIFVVVLVLGIFVFANFSFTGEVSKNLKEIMKFDFFEEREEPICSSSCENYQICEGDICVTDVDKLKAFRVMPPSSELLKEVEFGKQELPSFFYNGILEEGIQPTKNVLGQEKGEMEQFKILVVLIDFNDNIALTDSLFFDNLLYGNEEGTVKHYYLENSYNQLDLITLNLPSSLGWIRAQNTYEYYVGGLYGTGVYPHNSQKLVEEIVDSIDAFVDFSEYDNDGDGYVDSFYIVHSGSGAEETGSPNDIWSHSWSINPKQKDGVKIVKYAIGPEYWLDSGDMTIGVICHELGHAMLLLPDLYDADYSSGGIGEWGLMSYGSWNGVLGSSPSHLSAWSKYKSGFAQPLLVEEVVQADLAPSELEDDFYKLQINEENLLEYFLIENRQRVGYDSALPGEGVLIWHIDEEGSQNDEWYPGYTDEGHYLVALEQSDGLWELEKNGGFVSDPLDPYNFFSGCIFDHSSIPSSEDYSFTSTGFCLEVVDSVEANSSVISVVISKGDNCEDLTDLDGDEYSICEGDCNDLNSNINPDEREVCDYIDNNCDGQIDEGVINVYYLDSDCDGYGVDWDTQISCSCPLDHSNFAGDCDDSDPNINPASTELCDGVDGNCDGVGDYVDLDVDGYVNCQDCNDNDSLINPGMNEICSDGVDNDCDFLIDSYDTLDCTCEGKGGICVQMTYKNPICPSDYPYKHDSAFFSCPASQVCCNTIAPSIT